MNKVSVSLPQGEWGTLKTKYPKDSNQVKFNELTGTSKNFDTEVTGAITKRPGYDVYNSSATTAAANDQYEAIFPSGTHHLLEVDSGVLKYSAGTGTFSTVTSGYSAAGNFEFTQYQGRVYGGNGLDSPICYDLTTSYGGASYTAPKTKVMGALVPTAPTVALVSDSTASQVPAGTHTYKVTYLYYGSEESNGSPVSSSIVTDGTHTQVTVTIPVGGYGVTARKIYRDNNDGNWLLVATVSDNTSTTYADKVPTTTTPIPTDNGLPPTFGKINLHLDRLWVSNGASTIYFSQPGLPDLFSSTGYVTCNSRDVVVAHIVFNGNILVFNRRSLGWITGKDTSTFAYRDIPGTVGCVDNRSIQIRTNSGIPTVVWLADNNLYEFNGSSIQVISDDIEDQISGNLQQGNTSTGFHLDDTQADFQAGTASAPITLTQNPGYITAITPQRVWSTTADWEGGSSFAGIATKNIGNQMYEPVIFLQGSSIGGTFTGTAAIGSGSKLTCTANTTGSVTGNAVDTNCITSGTPSLVVAGTYPSGTSATGYVDTSADGLTGWTNILTQANPNGSYAVTGTGLRYLRYRFDLVGGSGNAPSLGSSCTFQIPNNQSWTSEALDLTANVSAYNALTAVVDTAGGTTSYTLTTASSADNISYTAFGAVGSTTVQRYVKIRITLTSQFPTSNNTPVVTSITFQYSNSGTFTSAAFTTGTTPFAWGVFQAVQTLNGGTATYSLRSATTSGGLSGASWVGVTPGNTISGLTLNPWLQYKVTLAYGATSVPLIDSVTTNWILTAGSSYRVSSLFYKRCYYLSGAEVGQTANNIIFKLDYQNKWRVYRGFGLSTMGLYNGDAYGGLSTVGTMVKWLTDTTDGGTNIALDVQTAAINYDDVEHNKILRQVYIEGKNTGATYTPTYSVDNGLTWKSMVDPKTGSATFTTAADGGIFTKAMMPSFAGNNATGSTHIFRLQSSDVNKCEIHAIKFMAWIRKGEPRG